MDKSMEKGQKMEKQKEKNWLGVLGGGDRIERKVDKWTFIEKLLCTSDYAIMMM